VRGSAAALTASTVGATVGLFVAFVGSTVAPGEVVVVVVVGGVVVVVVVVGGVVVVVVVGGVVDGVVGG
jgi:hypothetical protein